MIVMTMPRTPHTADVIADGTHVAVIERVQSVGYVGFDGISHTGERWIPTGLPTTIEGPTTRQDAALLALAEAGYDHKAAAKALGFRL